MMQYGEDGHARGEDAVLVDCSATVVGIRLNRPLLAGDSFLRKLAGERAMTVVYTVGTARNGAPVNTTSAHSSTASSAAPPNLLPSRDAIYEA